MIAWLAMDIFTGEVLVNFSVSRICMDFFID